jgi:hypothetical protein
MHQVFDGPVNQTRRASAVAATQFIAIWQGGNMQKVISITYKSSPQDTYWNQMGIYNISSPSAKLIVQNTIQQLQKKGFEINITELRPQSTNCSLLH